MARFQLTFSIRHMLVAVLLTSILLGFVGTIRRAASSQSHSVQFLNESGCWIPPGHKKEPAQDSSLFVLTHPVEPGPFQFEWLFGREAYLFYPEAHIENNCKLNTTQLVQHLKNLQGLENVYYWPGELENLQIEQLQQQLSSVRILPFRTE